MTLDLQARYDCYQTSYTRASDMFFEPFRKQLEAELKDAINRRDGLVGGLPGQVQALKDKIHRQLSILSGDFSS